MQGRRDSDSDNAAEVAASDDSMKAEDGDSISSGYSPVVVGASSDASTEWDQASRESNERWLNASELWTDLMDVGPHQEGENYFDPVGTSGGDGGRGSVAPPGVGDSPYAKGVGKGKGKGKGKAGDEIWTIGMMTHIVQPPYTDTDQDVRQRHEAQEPRLGRRSPQARRRRLQRAEARDWQAHIGNMHRRTNYGGLGESDIDPNHRPISRGGGGVIVWKQ